MKFLVAIMDALMGFVQRNPLTILVILALAVGAPALLKGIAMFALYFILGIVVLVLVLAVLFRWKINKMRRQMEEQLRSGGFGPQGSASPFGAHGRQSNQQRREGDIKVHKTTETPEKRVAKDVGDYVEFEETKE